MKTTITAVCLLLALTAGAPSAPAHPHHPNDDGLVLAAPTVFAAIRLGAGAFEFESEPGWCKLPDERKLGNTHGGIVQDEQGRVYFNTDTERSICVFTRDGKFLRSFGEEFPGIHGMVLRKEGGQDFLYAAHLHGKQAVKFSLDGNVIWKLGLPKESGKYDDNPAAYNPTAIAVGPEGDLYLADGYGRNWIHHYTADRKYVRSFGGPGSEPGQFRTCHGMILDSRGDRPHLIVCDRENRRLQRFTLDGKFVDVVTTGLRRPCAVSILGDHVAVAELEGRVTILDRDFKVVTHLGDNPNKKHWANNGVAPADWVEGVFTAPHSCLFDRDGSLYVMDWNATGRVSKLKRLGD